MHLQSVAVLLAAAMLVGATVSDLRTRRVANQYWLPFLAGALLLDALRLLEDPALWLPMLLSVASCGVFYLMWRLRAFGGADAKGLMVLSLLLPIPVGDAATIPALDILVDALLFAVLMPLGFLAWNLAHGKAPLPASFLGFPMAADRARTRAVWPMQRPDGEGGLRWIYRRPLDDPWPGLEALGIDRVWVTPKVPFMLFLLLGLGVDLAWGDLVVRLASLWVL